MPPDAVILSKAASIARIDMRHFNVFGRPFDLILAAVHPDLLIALVDPVDDAGRQQHFLAKDPRASVNDEKVMLVVIGLTRRLSRSSRQPPRPRSR